MKLAHLAEESENGSVSYLSTKFRSGEAPLGEVPLGEVLGEIPVRREVPTVRRGSGEVPVRNFRSGEVPVGRFEFPVAETGAGGRAEEEGAAEGGGIFRLCVFPPPWQSCRAC